MSPAPAPTPAPPPAPASAARSAAASPPPSNFQLLLRMLRFIRPVWHLALIACVLVCVWVVIDVSYTRLTGNVMTAVKAAVDQGLVTTPGESFAQALRHPPLRHILTMVEFLGLLVFLGGVIRFFREFVNTTFSMEMVFHMRSAVYDRLQRVGFAFHDEHSSGALINRALSDLQNVRAFLQIGLIMSSEIVTFTLGYELLIITINKWVALAAFIPIPFWIWYILRFSKKIQPAQAAQMKAGDDVVTVFTENIAGVHVVKAFATEKTEEAKYNRSADVYFGKIMASVRLWRNFVPVIRGVASASHLALFAIGSVLVVVSSAWPADRYGKVTVGDLLVFGMAMGAILSRLQQINQISEQYQKAIVSARRFYEVLDAPPTVPEGQEPAALPPGPGAIDFHFVTFGYDPAKPVVHDIAFDVPGGSIVALVGPTGAGKSTLMQLLARFYDPQAGQIFIDGADISTVALRSLRSEIGFVFQETFLFSATVADNIRYGKPDATIGEVEAAARIAQAHEFIAELPLGYDTLLGERGASLSGGQRQRLAIARAIISNPRILVLDDALAAVDPETEHLISRALELVMVDRTVFIIAHRLSTVKAADLVIVLENGRITQAGTHKELIREPGHYRHIAEVQLAYQEKELLAKAEKQADIAARKA
ncbi:MAG TPA: ABC transporter ATP-binding protein [Phycisphaerae bacterium]|nr:ABC transporter ATP-binding protein [Phycisphaerae bacterium]